MLQQAPSLSSRIITKPPLGCVEAVKSGLAQAYLDDDLVINWYEKALPNRIIRNK